MNNETKNLKDIEYYNETVNSIKDTEEYLDFVKNYKENKIQKSEQSTNDAYITSVSFDLLRVFKNNLKGSNTASIKDREILFGIGKYLDTLELLRERIALNNQITARKDPAFNYKANNPFFITHAQIKKEFDIAENKKIGECEVCAKNMFWANKTIKTVRGLRFGRQNKYAKDNKLNNKVLRNILYNAYTSKDIRSADADIMHEYNSYVNGIISFDEFKQNGSFQKLKNTINKNMKDNASMKGKIPEIDINFLMHDLTLSNLLNELYQGKIYYMEKAIDKIKEEGILKRNKIKAGTFNRKNKQYMSIIIPKYNMPFEVKLDKVYVDRDLDKLDLDFKNKKRKLMPSKKTIVYKLSKEQQEKLKETTESLPVLNKPARNLVTFTNDMVKGKTKEIVYDLTKQEEERVK